VSHLACANLRHFFAYNPAMGEMKRANAYEEQRRTTDRFASTLAISASIIAAVRLARDDISTPSPRLTSVVFDSVKLARMILERIIR
jgi:hypothetical protein